MPGFSDNLRRAREAAGLTSEDLADRVGAAPIWLAHLEALGASLPELPHLVRLADALGCRIDDLLAGGDADFDHPRRRHAALIAARLGRINIAQTRVNASRARGELTRLDELCLDEPSLLAIVCRCRGWVTSPTSELSIATTLERELDDHLERLTDVMRRVDARVGATRPRTPAALTRSVPAPLPRGPLGTSANQALPASGVASGSSPALPVSTGRSRPDARDGTDGAAKPAPPPKAAAILKGDAAASAVKGAMALPQLADVPATSPPSAAPVRRPGRHTTMWTRPATGDDEYICEMVTDGAAVQLVLLCGERELAAHPCKNMDEAFTQSSKWKRLPDPDAHFAESVA